MTHPADRDALLEFRREAAQALVTAAENTGWFTAEQMGKAYESSNTLAGEFVLSVERALDDFDAERAHGGPCGDLPTEVETLALRLTDYLGADFDCHANAMAARQRKPHAFVHNGGAWCDWCGGAMPAVGHRRGP